MTVEPMPQAMRRLVDFLGELGPRWGLPAEACRVHGYLYLIARPAAQPELQAALPMDGATLKSALAWLSDFRLITRTRDDAWRTDGDPWDLMMRALEERRRRELGPALETLRACRREADVEDGLSAVTRLQIAKLLSLAEDVAAIDMQARRLPPNALRQMVGLGGRAARLIDRTFGGRGDRG